MIINTSEFASLPNLTNAFLRQCTDGVSTLSLGWSGPLPEWVQYMAPVTVIHRGTVLFHGKITEVAVGNSGGDITSECTVSDFLWALDHQTLGEQLAQITESLTNEAEGTLEGCANTALVSWAKLAESLHMSLPNWLCKSDGTPIESAEISLETSRAKYSFGAYTEKRKAVSGLTALLEMQQANPDCFFLPDYVSGKLSVISITNADSITWDTQEMRLTETSGISPCYEDAVTGVCGVVTCGKRMRSVMYPEDIPVTSNGVKVFSMSVETSAQAKRQLDHIVPRLKAWYEAANILQHNGTVTAILDDVDASPIGKRLSITGKGSVSEWTEMQALVTACEWDFSEGLVTITLGKNIDEPELHALNFETSEKDGTAETGNDDGGGDQGDDVPPDDSASEEFSTWSYDTTGSEETVGSGSRGSVDGTQYPPTPGGSQASGENTGTQGTGACCDCPQYEFDSEWFTVTQKGDKTEVSINESKVQAIAEEIVSNIELQVAVTGIAEVNANGTLYVSTDGSGTVDRGEATTKVSY